jgi:prolyl oligopeptidase PreP (S9A serine peptidase family)
MVTTGDHDDRVVPAHSFKFAAELQEKQTGNDPVLIRIDVKAGHGAGKSLQRLFKKMSIFRHSRCMGFKRITKS